MRLNAESCDPASSLLRLSAEDAIARLTYIARGESPREALAAAIAWRDEVTPRLIEELSLAPVDVAARYAAEPPGKAYYLHTLAFYLLAHFREPKAFPLMLDYFASDGDLAEELSGLALSGYLPAMLVRCWDGASLPRLELMIKTEAFEPIFRHECLKAYHGLALAGHCEKAQVVGFVRRLVDEAVAATGSWWSQWLALAAAELQAPELRAGIEALLDRVAGAPPERLGLLRVVGKEDIADIYADRPERIAKGILTPSFFDNMVERICRWDWFSAKGGPGDAAEQAFDGSVHGLPHERTLPKVGRNAPVRAAGAATTRRAV